MAPSPSARLGSPRPLDRGSVSLRIYPPDLAAQEVVADVQHQARLAEEAGFDGCMVAEHHGGFPNYLPNPLPAATWILGATQRIWAAPCPLLLPLRPVTQVIEDLAWTHHRFPGRLGVGVGAGSFPVDFRDGRRTAGGTVSPVPQGTGDPDRLAGRSGRRPARR